MPGEAGVVVGAFGKEDDIVGEEPGEAACGLGLGSPGAEEHSEHHHGEWAPLGDATLPGVGATHTIADGVIQLEAADESLVGGQDLAGHAGHLGYV